MRTRANIKEKLKDLAANSRSNQEELVREARRILKQELFSDKKILDNLKQYNKANEVLDEENIDSDLVFRIEEIRKIAIVNRLKFLESKLYKSEVPYEAVLRIKYLNDHFYKDIAHFRILSHPESFVNGGLDHESLLFAKTNYDNYYLIHSWGKKPKWYRHYQFWPLKKFETLVISLLIFTLVIALVLPTRLITLDASATYWSGYRAAAFFHLLIFNLGVTAYITFAFGKNFSSSIWNKYKDFD
ncbi:MAG: hypothetical protein JNL60_04845 [Bacteroidia bacterium]|nr:hypothetical protein [Bacteroidia bacterium]